MTARFIALVTLICYANALACASIMARTANAPSALSAPTSLSVAERLDVAVVVFDPGDVDPQYGYIRQCESKILANQLRETLVSTGHWGLVSVVPTEPIVADLTVTGEILESDGIELRLSIQAKDSSGRTWLESPYKTKTTDESYTESNAAHSDPYQPMFNTIANDLVKARTELTPEELRHIPEISDLRFAEALSPEAFSGYVERTDDLYEIRRLPARDDPMMERVLQVRHHDEMFVDTLSMHYQNFTFGIENAYLHWRQSSRQETLAERALSREQTLNVIATILLIVLMVAAGANNPDALDAIVVGGATVVAHQIQKIRQLGEEKSFHEESLGELDESFQAQVTPMVVELEGISRRLTGTASEQYQGWQALLDELYEAEAEVSEIYLAPYSPSEEDLSAAHQFPDTLLPQAEEPPDVAAPPPSDNL